MNLSTTHIVIGVAVITLVVALYLYSTNTVSQPSNPHQKLPLAPQPEQPQPQPQPESEKVMALFTMNGCGHCVKFEPVWDEFSQNFNGYNGVKIVKIKADEHPELVQLHNISGFPTVKMCINGIENQTTVTYDGDRSFDSLAQFLEHYA